jgi:triacylglycerol lipase
VFALPPLPELHEAKVFGRTLRYYDIGAGPPLVLVHGLGGDADQWAFCFERLAAAQRVIAIDLPGFGRSDKPLIDYRVAGYVEVLERFATALGIERAAWVGHSLGGWVVAALALASSARVDALVLADAVGLDSGSVPLPCDLNVSTRANLRAVFEAMFFDRRMASDALVDLAYELHLARGDGYTIRSLLETLASPAEKLDGKLGGIDAPTLLLWGERDAITPLAAAHAWERAIAGSRLHVIPRCGHLPMIEAPREFAATIVDFLAARDAARA